MGRDRKPHLLDGGHLEHAVLACRDRGGGLRLHLDGEGLAAGGNPTRSRGREPNSGNPFLVRKQGEGAGLGDSPPLLAAAQTGNRIPGASLAPKWRPVKSFLMSP